MLVPGLIFVLALFRYYPMYGVIIAFQDFSPAKGLRGIALDRLGELRISLFCLPEFSRIFGNTHRSSRYRRSFCRSSWGPMILAICC